MSAFPRCQPSRRSYCYLLGLGFESSIIKIHKGFGGYQVEVEVENDGDVVME